MLMLPEQSRDSLLHPSPVLGPLSHRVDAYEKTEKEGLSTSSSLWAELRLWACSELHAQTQLTVQVSLTRGEERGGSVTSGSQKETEDSLASSRSPMVLLHRFC